VTRRVIEMPVAQRRNGLSPAISTRRTPIPMEEPVPSGRADSTPSQRAEAVRLQVIAPVETCVPAPEHTHAPAALVPPRPEATPEAIRDLAVMMLEEDPERILDPAGLQSLVRAFCSDQVLPADLASPIQEAIDRVKGRWSKDQDALKASRQRWIVLRFKGFKEGRLPFPALNPVKELARAIFGTAVDQKEVASARVQELGAWAVDLRYLTQLQNEMNQLGIQVDCAQIMKEGKLRAVESSGRTFSSKAALLDYFATLPDLDPKIAALLRDASCGAPSTAQDEQANKEPVATMQPRQGLEPEGVAPAGECAPAEPEEMAVADSPKLSTVGLSAEVAAAIRQVLDSKHDGEALLTSEITPLILERYHSKYGKQLTRAVVLSSLNGKLKDFQRAGLIRLAEDRKVVGGTKTWAVVKPGNQQAEAPASARAAPQPAEQRPDPPAIVAANAVLAAPDHDGPAAHPEAELAQAKADNAALRQRVAVLEQELRQAREKIRLDAFFAQLRESKMRVVIEPE